MKPSSLLTTALFLLGATLAVRATPLTATPWALPPSASGAPSLIGVPTLGASGALAVDNNGPGDVYVKVEVPPPANPGGMKAGPRMTIHWVHAGESIGHLAIPATAVVHIVDSLEAPASGAQKGSGGTYCWTP